MSPPTTSQPGRQRDWLFRGWTSWAIPLALLALTILLAETTPWDEQIQNLFYSPERGWLLTLDKHRGFGLVYYTIPVRLIGAVSGLLLLSALWSLAKTRRFPWKRAYVLLCMAAIPSLVANLKSHNSMPYPKKILQYGGTCPKRSLLQAFRTRREPNGKRFHGWPAGHASGGFSLMGLAFCPEDPRKRRWGFAFSAALGGFMGLCHTMDGNHFFSHNLVSFFLAWLVASLLYLAVHALRKRFSAHPPKEPVPRPS